MAVLLVTLRCIAPYNDQSDLTYVERSGLQGTFSFPPTIGAMDDIAPGLGTVEFVRFFSRVSWYTSGFGPDPAQAWLQWTVGGSPENSDPELPDEGVGVFTQIQSLDRLLDPDFEPWDESKLNALQMRTLMRVDDGNSGETTFCQVSEMWAEVWGTPPAPPEPPPTPSGPDIILAAPLRSGHLNAPLAGGDLRVPLRVQSFNAPLRSGHIVGPGRPA